MAGSWVSFENNTPSCKRAMRLSDEHYLPALGLLLVIVCWCDDNLTDGHITDSALRRIAFGEWRTALNALVEVEWLHETEDGYQVHDYTDWQRSSEQIKELSEKRKAAARARWASKGDASAVQDALQVHSNRSAKCNAQTESTDSTDLTDLGVREQTPFQQAHALIEKTYGNVPPLKQRERLRIMADNYGPDVITRLRYGISKAAAAGKPNSGYAIGCAESASRQEIGAFAPVSAACPCGGDSDCPECLGTGRQLTREEWEELRDKAQA